MTIWILILASLLTAQADVVELQFETRRLVRQLDGASLAEREAAERRRKQWWRLGFLHCSKSKSLS